MATCSRCHQASTDRTYCLPCEREYRRERYAANPQVRESIYAWRRANPEKFSEYQRKSVAAKPEKYREGTRVRMAAWRGANRERDLESARRYRAAHRAETRAATARWEAAHPLHARRASRRFQLVEQLCAHPSCLAIGTVQLAWQLNPHECWMCGRLLDIRAPRTDPAHLHMDHVIPLAAGGLNCAENLRPACAPCNRRKGATLRKVA